MTLSTDSTDFFSELPGFSSFSDFSEAEHYRPVPDDWHVAITDVAGSTAAIAEGRYREVNSISTASIVAMLDAASPVRIPYVFGGDGATACVPPAALKKVEQALAETRRIADSRFGLDLRAGIVPVSELRIAGHEITVARYEPNANFRQAMFQGGGLTYAEKLIKEAATAPRYAVAMGPEHRAKLERFECRWQECPSPHEETASILVQVLAKDPAERRQLFSRIYGEIANIYGDEADCHPLRVDLLQLARSRQELRSEIRLRTIGFSRLARWRYALKLRFLIFAGRILMARGIRTQHGDWGQYKAMLVANTDYRKCDETLRMILAGTREQRSRLEAFLEPLSQQGKLAFGTHASKGALLTCMIFDYEQDHVHFLDGADGGYAMAAVELKRQLTKRAAA